MPDDMDSKIFAFVYVTAMRDATLQGSYRGEKACLTNCSNFPSSTQQLKNLVKYVLHGKFKNQDAYDIAFLSVTKSLCKEINDFTGNNNFTFGNAQKLINIMMKYFYLHTYGNLNAKENFKFCHCPMDQQLIKVVWKKRDKLSSETCSMLGERSNFISSWSKDDFENGDFPEHYKTFQLAVRELSQKQHISSIEFDYINWRKPI